MILQPLIQIAQNLMPKQEVAEQQPAVAQTEKELKVMKDFDIKSEALPQKCKLQDVYSFTANKEQKSDSDDLIIKIPIEF